MIQLERRLGLGSVIAISISAMLGSGIFVLPGVAIPLTGPSLSLAYLLAGLCILPAAISKSELATAMPTSGGTYVYIERTFGPMAGTIAGLGLWLSLLLKSAFALVGFGAYLELLAPNIQMRPTALTILAILVLLNNLGVGKVSSALIVIMGVVITYLTGITIYGIASIETFQYSNFFTNGLEGLLNATALVFVSFAGVTKVAAIAEEITEPEKNVPKGILYSLLIVTLLYAAVTFILAQVVPLEDLSNNLRPLHIFATTLGGNGLGVATAILAVFTMSSMSNSGILAASRFPFAMSRDKLLPSKIGRIHPKFLTPTWSINLSGLVVAICIYTLDINKIAKLASVFMILIYMIENIAVIVLREARVQWYKPTYKTRGYPYVQIAGIIMMIVLLVGMGNIVLPALLSISIPGIIFYLLYSRTKVSRRGVIGIRGRRQDLVTSKIDNPAIQEVVQKGEMADDANVVVALFGKERSPEMLIEMGVALAEHGNLEVAHITEVPEQTDLSDLMDEPANLRSLRRRVVAMAVEKKEPITFDPVLSHDIAKTVFHISQRLHSQWLLIEWTGKTSGAFTFGNTLGWLRNHLHCHLAVFRDAGVRYIRKIMVFLRDSKKNELTIETADHLAEVNRADITLVKWVPESMSLDDKQKLELDLSGLGSNCQSNVHVRVVQGLIEIDTIIAQTAEYDLIVFESENYGILKSLKGTPDDRLMAKAACSVITVQPYEDESSS